MVHHLAIFNNWTMRGSSFKQIKLSKSLENTRKTQKTAHKGLFCSLQSNSAPHELQQLFTGKATIVLKSLPAVVLLLTASEKENLRTEREDKTVLN